MNRIAVTVAVVLLALAPPALARRRAVHHPAAQCAYSLAPAWSGPIAAAGVTRAAVLVYGQSQQCAGWAAYSSASWATVEAAPMDAQPAAYVTIAPNPDPAPRTVTLIIAGVRLQVTQDAASTVSPPRTFDNLVVNGTFDGGIAPWGWQARFPNGRGTAQWSSFDANGNPQSGSILLRDEDGDLAFQQLQCVAVEASTRYRFGATVRSASTNGNGIMAVFLYASPTCAGSFTDQTIQTIQPSQLGVWQRFSWTTRTRPSTQAVIVVIAAGTNAPPYEMWFDDVFVRKE